jgi:hypothetical protein
MLERFFKLNGNHTTVRTEIMAGMATFLTMAYIVVVQPAVLSGKMFGHPTGMDFGAVMTATCLSAALATAIMALYARYPIAQAPGMGENFFFVFSAIPAAAAAGFPNPWQVALGAVFISGALFLVLSLLGVRELIFNAVTPSLKYAAAAGIGLFIAFIGLQNAGVIVKDPGTAVKLNPHLASPDLLIFFAALLVTAVLQARRARGHLVGHRRRHRPGRRPQGRPASFAADPGRFARRGRFHAGHSVSIRPRRARLAALSRPHMVPLGLRPRPGPGHAALCRGLPLHARVRRHWHAHRRLRTGRVHGR